MVSLLSFFLLSLWLPFPREALDVVIVVVCSEIVDWTITITGIMLYDAKVGAEVWIVALDVD